MGLEGILGFREREGALVGTHRKRKRETGALMVPTPVVRGYYLAV